MYMKNKNFTMVPNQILEPNQLTPIERLLLIELHRYKRRDPFCYPTQQLLADCIGVTPRYVRDLLERLEKYALIKKVREGFNTSNIYYVAKKYWIDDRNPNSPLLRTVFPIHIGTGDPTTKKQIRRYRNKSSFERIGSIMERSDEKG